MNTRVYIGWLVCSIIFSSWKRTLQLVSRFLTLNGISCLQIDGSVSVPERKRIISAFERGDDNRVLLMTMGTGAEGWVGESFLVPTPHDPLILCFSLNLTVANRLYLLEPQWNPSIERQAIGRAVRLGQREEVHIVRFIVKDTVEMVGNVPEHAYRIPAYWSPPHM